MSNYYRRMTRPFNGYYNHYNYPIGSIDDSSLTNYYRRATGPIYSYFNHNNNPIGPIDDSWLYSDHRNPTIRRPRLEWDGPQPSRQNAIHAGLFNEFSKNRDVASPAFVDEFITVPQEYDDDYNYFTNLFR